MLACEIAIAIAVRGVTSGLVDPEQIAVVDAQHQVHFHGARERPELFQERPLALGGGEDGFAVS